MIESPNLTPVPSQAEMTPLTEELGTGEVLQFAGKRLENHCVFLDCKSLYNCTTDWAGRQGLIADIQS